MSPDLSNRLTFYAQVENVIIGFSNRSLSHGGRLAQKRGLRQ
jgi:hypothetical protein